MLENKNWTGPAAARHFVIWVVLWVLIELAIVAWIFYSFSWAEETASPAVSFTLLGIASSVITKRTMPNVLPVFAKW